MGFWFGTADSRRDIASPKERSELARELLPVVGIVRDPVVRAHYLQRLSRLALVSEGELAAMLAAQRRGTKRGAPERPARAVDTADARGDTREEFLLALLLQHPQLRPDVLAREEAL